jgi:putative PIN family toxin of toxin-antitoxin system
MIRVVVDTNVLVSAVLKGSVSEAIMLFLVADPDFEWVVSEEILLEYKSVLGRKKFKLSPEIQERWFKIIDAFTSLIHIDVSIDFPRDPKDAKFLECAIACSADYLITGDRDFESFAEFQGIEVVSASRFLELFVK